MDSRRQTQGRALDARGKNGPLEVQALAVVVQGVVNPPGELRVEHERNRNEGHEVTEPKPYAAAHGRSIATQPGLGACGLSGGTTSVK